MKLWTLYAVFSWLYKFKKMKFATTYSQPTKANPLFLWRFWFSPSIYYYLFRVNSSLHISWREICTRIFKSPMCAIFLAHHFLIIFGVYHKLWNPSLCNSLLPPVTVPLSAPYHPVLKAFYLVFFPSRNTLSYFSFYYFRTWNYVIIVQLKCRGSVGPALSYIVQAFVLCVTVLVCL